MNERAEVKYDPAIVTPEEVAAMITDIGYDAEVIADEKGKGVLDLLVS